MPTAREIITNSCQILGYLGRGETASSEDASDFLVRLNAMLDSWQLQRLFVYQVQQLSGVTLTASTGSYTIGSGGDIDVTRPLRIESAFIRDSNSVDIPVQVLMTREAYDQIAIKTTESSYPAYLFYDTGYPLGTIYLYPVPSQAYTLFLHVWTPLQSFDSLTESLSLPPGYQRAIEYNLAMEIAPMTGFEPTGLTMQIAVSSVASIKRNNARPILSTNEMANTGRYDIYSDGF